MSTNRSLATLVLACSFLSCGQMQSDTSKSQARVAVNLASSRLGGVDGGGIATATGTFSGTGTASGEPSADTNIPTVTATSTSTSIAKAAPMGAATVGGVSATTTQNSTPLSAAENAKIQAYLSARYSPSDVKHSFLTKAAETIDCVDYFATPEAKELASKGTPLTTLPQPPPPPPLGLALNTGPATDEFWFNGYPDAFGRPRACPEGTVPILRQSVADIQASGGLDAFLTRTLRHASPPPAYECPSFAELPGYAHVVKVSELSGTGAGITQANAQWMLYQPVAPQDTQVTYSHSIDQLWLMTGCGLNSQGITTCNNDQVGQNLIPCMRTLEVGSMVATEYGNTNLHFKVLATNNGYHDELNFHTLPGAPTGPNVTISYYGNPGGTQQTILVSVARSATANPPGWYV